MLRDVINTGYNDFCDMEQNISTYELWDKIYKKFENNICRQCFAQTASKHGISHPQPIPFVGSEYEKTKFKLMRISINLWFCRF